MRNLAFCICENKAADQLRGNREADQRLCFRYSDSTIPLLPKSEVSSLKPSSVVVQPALCGTWSETPNTGFLTTRLILLSGVVTRLTQGHVRTAQTQISLVIRLVGSSLCFPHEESLVPKQPFELPA